MKITLKIAGTRFYNTEPPRPGTALILDADPDNPHDSNAIRILEPEAEEQLGHVPAPAAAVISLVCNSLGVTVETAFEARMERGEEFTLTLRKPFSVPKAGQQ